jgi:hypothetical protein
MQLINAPMSVSKGVFGNSALNDQSGFFLKFVHSHQKTFSQTTQSAVVERTTGLQQSWIHREPNYIHE